jgi:hypothetical protein
MLQWTISRKVTNKSNLIKKTMANTNNTTNNLFYRAQFNDEWFVGFCDGEASFIINIIENKNSSKYQVKSMFSLPQHNKNQFLLDSIKSKYEEGNVYKDTGSREVSYYRSTSLKFLSNTFVPLFEANPLKTSKSLDYQDWKTVIDMMNNNEHLTEKGLNVIKLLSNNMNSKRDRSSYLNPNKIEITPNWLLGFIEAEGNFYVTVTPNKTSKLGYRVITNFSIAQNAVERPVLLAIQNYFGCGSIVEKQHKFDNRKLMLEYRITGMKDINNILIPFFENHKLITTKLLDYLDFKEVMEICNNGNHSTENGLNKIRGITSGMNNKRIFPL